MTSDKTDPDQDQAAVEYDAWFRAKVIRALADHYRRFHTKRPWHVAGRRSMLWQNADGERQPDLFKSGAFCLSVL